MKTVFTIVSLVAAFSLPQLSAQPQLPPTMPWMRPEAWNTSYPQTIISCSSTVKYYVNGLNGNQVTQIWKDATLFASEIAVALNCNPNHIQAMPVGDYTTNSGDIFLGYDMPGAGEDGYNIASTGVLWASGDPASSSGDGLFYGTRSLLQMIVYNATGADANGQNKTATIPGGGHGTGANNLVDRPYFPERGMMIDLGNEYMDIPHLETLIRELAFVKMNYLQLNFADNGDGFRLYVDPSTEPQGQNMHQYQAPRGEFYTQQDITNLIDYAHKYHIRIWPDMDMPGHCQWLLHQSPSFLLQIPSSGGYPPENACDITKDQVRQTMEWFVATYANWFDDWVWFGGGDEWTFYTAPEDPAIHQLSDYAQAKLSTGDARDVQLQFENEIDDIVRNRACPAVNFIPACQVDSSHPLGVGAQPKWLRLWSDVLKWKSQNFGRPGLQNQGTYALNTDILFNVWENVVDPNEFMNANINGVGYNIDNTTFIRTYAGASTNTEQGTDLAPSMYSSTNQWTPLNGFFEAPGDAQDLGHGPYSVTGYFGGDVDHTFNQPCPQVNQNMSLHDCQVSRVKGSFYSFWRRVASYSSQQDEEDLKALRPRMRVFAQTVWASPVPTYGFGSKMEEFAIAPNTPWGDYDLPGSISATLGWAPDGSQAAPIQ